MNFPLHDLVRAMRPKQWTKNAVVFAPFVFALGDVNQDVVPGHFGIVLCAAVAFCMVSSGIYLVNDVRDQESDRLHPHKKDRPVASGAITPAIAITAAIGLVAGALLFGYALAPSLALVLLTYAGMQLAYTFVLRQFAMIDVLVIATGFMLRAIAGAAVIQVTVTAWLLVCAYLLAVFLALCKRRQEYVSIEDAATYAPTRGSLVHYNERLLDQLIAIVASATLVCYAIYTLAPETVLKYGSHQLGLTLPFVLFGLFRYLFLVYRHDLGERPEQVLLTDVPMLINLALYGAAVLIIIL